MRTTPITSPYFYPRSPRGERPHPDGDAPGGIQISIHAPREGSDWRRSRNSGGRCHFYPRSPRGERPSTTCWPLPAGPFLSTLPARGATAAAWASRSTCCIFLSTLPARGATQHIVSLIGYFLIFLSTLPARGATSLGENIISTFKDFYPRSPRGERRGTADAAPPP